MDPISRGGNCQKVAAHILHPPVDLIMVNNNMVNSIGRVPRPTYRDIFFLTFFPALRIHQHWYLKRICLSILQLKFMFVTFFKLYKKLIFSSLPTFEQVLYRPSYDQFVHAHHVLHFIALDVYPRTLHVYTFLIF